MKKAKNLQYMVISGGVIAALLLQYFLYGPLRAPDTAAFESFSHAVYPLYAVILYLFRTAFGIECGYYLLGVLQNLLLASSILVLVKYLQTTFRFSHFVSFAMSFGMVLMFLVQRWLTRAGTISSNTLFSEAFSIPFYFMFFRYALDNLINHEPRTFVFACLWAFLLIMTRGQLYWVLIVIFALGICVAGKSRVRAFVSAVIACILIAGGVQGARFLQTFHYEYSQTKNPASLIVLSTAIYCSDSEDVLLFEEGSGERQLFTAVRNAMDTSENGIGFGYETGNLTQRHGKFEAEYDALKEVVNKLYKKLDEQGISVSLGNVAMKLIRANVGAFVLHCMQNALVALVRTVSILRPGLDVYALAFFAAMIIFLIVSRKRPHLASVRKMVALGMICSLLNAIVMAPGVFALSRYVFYNMPIMYLTAAIIVCTSVGAKWMLCTDASAHCECE